MQRGNNPGCAGPRMLDRSGLNLPCRPLFSWDYEPRIWFYMLSVIYDTGVFLAGKGPNPCTANIHKGLKRIMAQWKGHKRSPDQNYMHSINYSCSYLAGMTLLKLLSLIHI